MPYPSAITAVLPGNQSFIVIAPAGTAPAAPGGVRVDHQGGNWTEDTRRSDYAASDSSYVRKIANKYEGGYTCQVPEETLSFFASFALGTYVDLYVKRSSAAVTFDKLAGALFSSQPKTTPEDGSSHRMLTLIFEGGTFTEAVAAGTLPTYM